MSEEKPNKKADAEMCQNAETGSTGKEVSQSADEVHTKPSEVNWQDRCVQLEQQIKVLKEVSNLRKTLLALRDTESKALKVKLKYLEAAVAEEKQSRESLLKRVVDAEMECRDVKDKLKRSIEGLDRIKNHHETQMNNAITNLETCELRFKEQSSDYEESQRRNSELKGSMEEMTLKLNEKRKAIKNLENKLKQSVDKSQFLYSQVSLIGELLLEHEKDTSFPVDMHKVKTILRQSAENFENDQATGEASKDSTSEKEESDPIKRIVENVSIAQCHQKEIPGEESCYKTIDTSAGPKMILSVSKTFIKLKDLILEKRTIQKEIDDLKNLNTKLESKVDQQEHRLYCVTKELNKTWSLVAKLMMQQDKLHNSESCLKHELKEKRVMLDRMKKEMQAYKEKWRQVREKNDETQNDWQQLKDEFAQRRLERLQAQKDKAEEAGASVPSQPPPEENKS